MQRVDQEPTPRTQTLNNAVYLKLLSELKDFCLPALSIDLIFTFMNIDFVGSFHKLYLTLSHKGLMQHDNMPTHLLGKVI